MEVGAMSDIEKKLPDVNKKGSRDNPEQYPTENESLFDMYESERTVDPIPMEDLKLEHREEKQKETTKHDSSSAEKYKTGM
jgi:hypothetical protein